MDHFEYLRRLHENIERETRWQRALALDQANTFEAAVRQYEALQQEPSALREALAHRQMLLERAAQDLDPTIRERLAIEEEAARWSDLLERSVDRTTLELVERALSRDIWQDSLFDMIRVLDDHRLSRTAPWLTEHLLVPYREYSSFSRAIIEQMEQVATSVRESAALSGALFLAEDQIASATELMRATLEQRTWSSVDDIGLSPLVVRIFETQRDELLGEPDVEEAENLEDLRSLSPTAQRFETAKRIAALAVACNKKARLIGDDEVFRPTTVYVEVQNRLQWMSADDDEALDAFVDCLYIMLYEGAGADSLRILKYLEKDQCRPLWVVKDLRNTLFRHDPDHGSEAKRQKKWEQLASALRYLGLPGIPNNREKRLLVQDRLLDGLESLLEHLLSSIPDLDE